MSKYNTLEEWENAFFPKAIERKLEQAGYQDAKAVVTASINRLVGHQAKHVTNNKLQQKGK